MESFWRWLFIGSQGGPRGVYNIVNRFMFFHVLVGVAAALLINNDPFTFAQKALFPAASILIGMSLAWTTRASTILQSKELRERLFDRERSAEDYIYGFQLAILIIISMVGFTAIMAGGGTRLHVLGEPYDVIVSAFWLYFLMSLSLRECWGVVNFTNMLSMLDYKRTR